MITVQFTSNIQRYVSCPVQTVSGKTLKEVMDRVFETTPEAKSYVLDDHGALQKAISHVQRHYQEVVWIGTAQEDPRLGETGRLTQASRESRHNGRNQRHFRNNNPIKDRDK